MSPVRVEGGMILFEGKRGQSAFVDVDWLPSDEGAVPAIVASARTLLSTWSEARWPRTQDPAQDAAAVLAAFAQRVARVADRLDSPGVVGDGAVARAVRTLAGAPAAAADRPQALVVCSGRASVIASALDALPMLGTVVLAGEGPDSVGLDLYPEVHVRGLHVLTVAPPAPDDRQEPGVDGLELLGRPIEVTSGTPIADAPRSGWIHLVR